MQGAERDHFAGNGPDHQDALLDGAGHVVVVLVLVERGFGDDLFGKLHALIIAGLNGLSKPGERAESNRLWPAFLPCSGAGAE